MLFKNPFWHLRLFIIVKQDSDLLSAELKSENKIHWTSHEIPRESCCALPECSAHRLIIHIWFVFVFAPELGHCFWVDQFEDPCLGIRPLDVTGTDLSILQQLHQELPQVKGIST